MASRSFKPASYLASAAQQAPNRSPRPSFTRSSSNSSTVSTRSEDSIVATLRGLSTSAADGKDKCKSQSQSKMEKGPPPPRSTTPVSGSPSVTQHDTPGRKRSQPIAIELPPRGTAVYTPLSARGDLPGGYFPNHEEVTKSYRSHPFSNHFGTSYQPQPESPDMSPGFTPTSDTTPRVPAHMLSSSAFGQFSPPIPEVLRIPRGKYHPSNYKSPVSSGLSIPTSTPRGSMPPTSLTIPSSKRGSMDRPGHERKTSDIKRKLQEYQRNMIAQAKSAAPARASVEDGVVKDIRPMVKSPRLRPLGSPGPITPFELEEGDGYIVAGSQEVRKENQRQLEMILNTPSQPTPAERRV